MKDTIHRLCPCHRYDIEGIQTWLEDMAKDGWILEESGYGLGTFTFQRRKPIRCRYRLEVLFEGKKNYQDRLDYLELLKDCGWSHATQFQGFDIFRTEDHNARELSTDPQIQASTLKKLKRESIHRVLFLIVYGFILMINERLSWIYLFRNAVTFGPLATGFMLCFILYAFMIPLIDILWIRKAEKQLKRGILLNQRKEWKPRAAWYRFCDILPVILCIVTIVSWMGGLFIAANQQELTSHPLDPPFVTVQDFADSGYTLETPPLSGSNYYVTWQNLVAPVNYEWREYASFTADGMDNTGFLVVEYHETISEWFARGLADDYYLYETARDRDSQDLEVPDYGLDEVRVFGNYGSYDILIRHGTTVIRASYSQWNDGTIPDWQLWLEATAQMLLAVGA